MKMAFYIDSENVLISNLDKDAFYNHILLKGHEIIIKQNYGDWRDPKIYDYWKDFNNRYGFDECYIKKQSGKNSVDTHIIVDMLEILYTNSHVNTFVLVGSDKDYNPLISKIVQNGKRFIMLGLKHSTSTFIMAKCSEFIDLSNYLFPIIELSEEFLILCFKKSGNNIMTLNTLEKRIKQHCNWIGDRNSLLQRIKDNFPNTFTFNDDETKIEYLKM